MGDHEPLLERRVDSPTTTVKRRDYRGKEHNENGDREDNHRENAIPSISDVDDTNEHNVINITNGREEGTHANDKYHNYTMNSNTEVVDVFGNRDTVTNIEPKHYTIEITHDTNEETEHKEDITCG